MTYKILVVDDDVRLQGLLSRYLAEQGFRPETASDSLVMNRLVQRHMYDLYILDINMPGEDGLQICKRLRASGDSTPIIMLTARGEDVDRIAGLELGADDYLAKPFNPRELLARIHAILRRRTDVPTKAHETEEFHYEFDGFVLDAATREFSHNGVVLPLNHNEFVLLKLLVQNDGKPLSRTQLSSRIYGKEHVADQRDIDMLVSRVRKQISKVMPSRGYIQTLRGIGYVFSR